jgi:2'-5' RNA ligase
VRLFTAVEIDPAAREQIAAAQHALARSLGAAADDFRFVNPAQMHLTIVFIGSVEADQAPALVDAMSRALPVSPFRMSFADPGAFPARGSARVLWLGVRDTAGELAEMHRLVTCRLEPLGIALETRPYVPHLTLARLRHSDGRRRRPAIDRGVAVSATTAVERVSLFSSQLTPQGSRYGKLATAPLVGER